MSLDVLGSIGIGLVWGWFLGAHGGRILRPVLSCTALALATLVVTGQVLWFSGWRESLLFLGMVLFASLIHLTWRSSLRRRSTLKDFHSLEVQ